MARRDRVDQAAHGDSPGIRLLDAMRAGDDAGVMAVCGEATTVSAENMNWSCRGTDQIHDMLAEVRRRFPGITFESRTRHVGFGLVIDEARVQDVVEDAADEPAGDIVDAVDAAGDDTTEAATEAPAEPVDTTPSDETSARHLAVPDPDVHPMWDEPVTEHRTVMAVWRDTSPEHLPPIRLNMPVRVTVRHDDLQVHDVTLSFPAALLKRALGMPVDPLEMSLSEVQSAFIAPVGAGLTSYELARPELALVPPPPPEPERWAPDDSEPPRRRRRWLAPVLLLLVALVAGGGWWVTTQGQDGTATAGTPKASPSAEPTQQATAVSSPSAPSTKKPTVSEGKPSDAPSRKPDVLLDSSDLAFERNSAVLSSTAKAVIDQAAEQVKAEGLTGTIYVNGYTDNLGSRSSGKRLSLARATAVAEYLGSRLVGAPVSIVKVAHGEDDPIASNKTEAGREKNRRVTITLPKS